MKTNEKFSLMDGLLLFFRSSFYHRRFHVFRSPTDSISTLIYVWWTILSIQFDRREGKLIITTKTSRFLCNYFNFRFYFCFNLRCDWEKKIVGLVFFTLINRKECLMMEKPTLMKMQFYTRIIILNYKQVNTKSIQKFF